MALGLVFPFHILVLAFPFSSGAGGEGGHLASWLSLCESQCAYLLYWWVSRGHPWPLLRIHMHPRAR